jgi:hypothetical protein
MAEINYRIVMQGLTENIIALERFAPDLKRELNKEIRGILAPIVLEARSYLPSNGEIHPSGWQKGGFKRFNGIGPLSQDQTRGFIAYDAERAKSGIKQTAATSKKNGTGFAILMESFNAMQLVQSLRRQVAEVRHLDHEAKQVVHAIHKLLNTLLVLFKENMALCQLLVAKVKIKVAQSFVQLIEIDLEHWMQSVMQLIKHLQKHNHALIL